MNPLIARLTEIQPAHLAVFLFLCLTVTMTGIAEAFRGWR